MKKIDRLREVESQFGGEYVLPYRICRTWQDIETAICTFERSGVTWGLRTDTPDGGSQAYHSPFLFHGNRKEAEEIFRANGSDLLYVVSENLLEVFCHGVALPIDEEHIVVEFNDSDHRISQREMYRDPKHLRRIGVGPASFVFFYETLVRSFHPHEVSDYRFDEVHTLMTAGYPKIDEITFSVRMSDRRLVIW